MIFFPSLDQFVVLCLRTFLFLVLAAVVADGGSEGLIPGIPGPACSSSTSGRFALSDVAGVVPFPGCASFWIWMPLFLFVGGMIPLGFELISKFKIG